MTALDSGKRRVKFASRLGFGASGIGTLYRDVTEEAARDVLAAAYAAGMRYFDTAPMYGHGLSELRLGQFLRTVPRESITCPQRSAATWFCRVARQLTTGAGRHRCG